jgi:pilus assembly protein CpaE
MAKQITVAVEINDSRLAKSLMDVVKAMPDVQAVQSYGSMLVKGEMSVKSTPNIIIIDDPIEGEDISQKLAGLRRAFPQASIFVVSPDRSPAKIIEVMKLGVAEYLVTPLSDKILEDAVEEVRVKLANAGQIARGSVYSFISSKGGLGSTVVAVNTAIALAMKKGQAVALCDMSFQSGDASVLLDIVPQTTIFDICQNFHRLDVSFLRGSMVKHASGVDFLAAPLNPEDSEEIRAEHVAMILDLAKKLYDHVIVDCASMFVDDCAVEALKVSEKIFVITDLSVPAVRNTSRLCKLIEKMGVNPSRLHIAVNRYIKGGTLSVEEVEKTLGRRIFWLFPNDFNDIVSSINRGVPIVKNQSNAPFSRNLMEFTEKLLHVQPDAAYRGIRGAFGKAI